MSDWKEVVEEGKVFWISDYGNVYKGGEEFYIAMIPKVVRLGPFKTLNEAKQVTESHKELDLAIETCNQELLSKK